MLKKKTVPEIIYTVEHAHYWNFVDVRNKIHPVSGFMRDAYMNRSLTLSPSYLYLAWTGDEPYCRYLWQPKQNRLWS